MEHTISKTIGWKELLGIKLLISSSDRQFCFGCLEIHDDRDSMGARVTSPFGSELKPSRFQYCTDCSLEIREALNSKPPLTVSCLPAPLYYMACKVIALRVEYGSLPEVQPIPANAFRTRNFLDILRWCHRDSINDYMEYGIKAITQIERRLNGDP